jgi:hypothetical protein
MQGGGAGDHGGLAVLVRSGRPGGNFILFFTGTGRGVSQGAPGRDLFFRAFSGRSRRFPRRRKCREAGCLPRRCSRRVGCLVRSGRPGGWKFHFISRRNRAGRFAGGPPAGIYFTGLFPDRFRRFPRRRKCREAGCLPRRCSRRVGCFGKERATGWLEISFYFSQEPGGAFAKVSPGRDLFHRAFSDRFRRFPRRRKCREAGLAVMAGWLFW